jgi:hypothetical protein
MSAREAAMDALCKVCEDNRKVLDRDYQERIHQCLGFGWQENVDGVESSNPNARTLQRSELQW